MKLFTFLFALLIFKSSCDTASVESDAIKLETCDDAGRATVEKLSNIEATVTYLNNEGSIVVIVPDADKTKRFVACNLPEEVSKKDGTSIILSGNVKEIKPNERWAGTPIEMTTLKIIVKP